VDAREYIFENLEIFVDYFFIEVNSWVFIIIARR